MNNEKNSELEIVPFDVPELELPYFPFFLLDISKDWLW